MSAGQSVSTSIQVLNGVGRHLDSLSGSQIMASEKASNPSMRTIDRKVTMRQAGYSSDLLLVISLGVSKISILILLLQISPVTLHRRLAAMLGGFIVIWSIPSLLASAFQCDLPSAWMIVEGRCFDQVRYSTLQSQLTLFYSETGY